jgi:hypothetical protein
LYWLKFHWFSRSDVKYPHFWCTDKEVAIVKFCLNYNISTKIRTVKYHYFPEIL